MLRHETCLLMQKQTEKTKKKTTKKTTTKKQTNKQTKKHHCYIFGSHRARQLANQQTNQSAHPAIQHPTNQPNTGN